MVSTKTKEKWGQIKSWPNEGFLWVVDKLPQWLKVPVMVITLVFFLIFLYGFGPIILDKFPKKDEIKKPTSELANVLGQNDESPIVRRVNDEKVKDKCSGAQFDIVGDFVPSNNVETLKNENVDDTSEVSAAGTKNFQGSFRSPFGCALPFVATISTTPLSGPSFGLFFELENVFKVLIGDGDRRAVKIQQNNLGNRGDWPIALREYLPRQLEIGKEYIVVIWAKNNENELTVKLQVLFPDDPIPMTFKKSFVPTAVNFNAGQERNFRIGINDFRYSGQGSTVRLGTVRILAGANW